MSNLTKDRLDPEPGRTSHACGIRLSQNTKNNAPHAFVNKNARVFPLAREAQANPSGEHRPLACWLRLPAETDFSAEDRGHGYTDYNGWMFVMVRICSSRTLRLSRAHDSHTHVSPSPL